MSAIIPSLTSRKGVAASGHTYDTETYRSVWETRLLRWCAWCWSRSRERRALAELDDRLLVDIGVTPQQATAEADKPFWK
jgi:uncharacterized protein YjiS (DUF1127 family)